MFPEHDPDGTLVSVDTDLLQRREEQFFLLSMVAFVHKYREKLQQVIHVLRVVQRARPFDLLSKYGPTP